LVHHLVNWDDWHLLAQAMASDFAVAWQCLSKKTNGFLLQIKLHAHTVVEKIVFGMLCIVSGQAGPNFASGLNDDIILNA
jgi:hypothetical protein